MKLLILGGLGMLGHKLYQSARHKFDTFCTLRDSSKLDFFAPQSAITGVDATEIRSVVRAIDQVQPDAIVNCIGLVKQLQSPSTEVFSRVNSLFPHKVSEICSERGIRFIQISTDCVFSGKKGMYTELDIPDPVDLYGRSKLLGEVVTGNSLTIRTSLIGRQLTGDYSLVEWFLSQRGRMISGYTNALFSGFTTRALSHILIRILDQHPELTGILHVASEPVSKWELLTLIRDAYNIPIEIIPEAEPKIDRTLDAALFHDRTGIVPLAWKQMIEEMTKDETSYNHWRAI